MSRTYRNAEPHTTGCYGGGFYWGGSAARDPKGDSKPWNVRFRWDYRGRPPYKCTCARCIHGKLHKHARQPQMFDYDGFEPLMSFEEWLEINDGPLPLDFFDQIT